MLLTHTRSTGGNVKPTPCDLRGVVSAICVVRTNFIDVCIVSYCVMLCCGMLCSQCAVLCCGICVALCSKNISRNKMSECNIHRLYIIYGVICMFGQIDGCGKGQILNDT